MAEVALGNCLNPDEDRTRGHWSSGMADLVDCSSSHLSEIAYLCPLAEGSTFWDLSQEEQQDCRDGASTKVQELVATGMYVLTFWDVSVDVHASGYWFLPMALTSASGVLDQPLYLGDS